MFSNFILIQAVLYCLSLSNRRGLVPGPPANTKSADAQVPHRQWCRIPLYRGCRIHSPLITCFFKSPALCFWGLSKQIHDALLRSFGLTIPQLVIQVCTLPVYMWKVSMGSFFFFQSFYLLYLFLAALGFHCCLGLSLVAASRAALLCGGRASHCGGFSCYRAWALGQWVSVVVTHGLNSYGLRALEHRLKSCGARA